MQYNYNEHLNRAVCKISCGDKNGTAFLISDSQVITASHCIKPYFDDQDNEIKLEFRNLSSDPIICKAIPIGDFSSPTSQVVILDLKLDIGHPNAYQIFNDANVKVGSIVEFYGYPYATTIVDGFLLRGHVSNNYTKGQAFAGDWNIHITPLETRIENFSGFSGSPLFNEDGRLVGLIGSQFEEGERAITVNAISVDRFQDYLNENGITVSRDDARQIKALTSNEDSAAIVALSREISNMQSIIQSLSISNDNLLDQRYNDLINLALDGSWSKARTDLDELLNTTSGSNGFHNMESKSCAKLYYLAALWSMPSNNEKAKSYFDSALSHDSNLDTRLYESSLLASDGKYVDAEKVLHPIDSTALLNNYLMIKYNREEAFDLDALLRQYNHISFNEGTYQAITLLYLDSSNLDKAAENALKLIQMREKSGMFRNLAGLVYYWKSIGRIVPHSPGSLFVIPLASTLLLNKQEISYAETAMEYFQAAHQLAIENSDMETVRNSLSGALTISWALNRMDGAKDFAIKLLNEEKDSPMASLCLLECGSHEHINLTALELRAHSDSFAAITYLRCLIKLEKYDLAASAIKELEASIKQSPTLEWIDLCIDLFAKRNDLASAYDMLSNARDKLPSDEYDRCLLYVSQFDKNKKPGEIISLATQIKNKYGQQIDFQNLCRTYRRFDKWKKVARVAKEWMRKLEDDTALSFVAESQWKLDKFQECLYSISQIEKQYELTPTQEHMRLDCLTRLSEFDKALALLANSGDLTYSDESLIVYKANLEFHNGNINESIRTLRMFIDSNDDCIDAPMLLAKILETEYPGDAFNVLKRLHEKYPERLDIAQEAMSLGYASGNEAEAGQLMMKIYQKDTKSEHMKSMTMPEMLDFIKERTEKFEPINQQFRNGLLPTHSIYDMQNIDMGFHAYSKWILKYNAFLPWAYGGRPEYSLVDVFKSKEVILDYTACITAECLDLFPVIEKVFEKIFISPGLIALMYSEIGRLSNVQESMKKRFEILHRFFKDDENSIAIIDDRFEPEDSIKAEYQDVTLYNTAKANNAYIVKNEFACKLFFGENAPSELLEIQLYESELMKILFDKGLIPEQKYEIKPRQDRINEALESGKPFIVDNLILEELGKLGDLSNIASILPMMILKSEIDMIERAVEAMSNQNDCVQWLKNLRGRLIELKSKGKLSFCPQSSIEGKFGPLTTMLFDCVTHSYNSGIPAWVDDRWMNSYLNIGKGMTFGVFDFIRTIHLDRKIDPFEYQKMVVELIRNDILYHVPSKQYVFELLKTSEIDNDGFLKEPRLLTELRQYISKALSSNSHIGRELRQNTSMPEMHGFIAVMSRLCNDLIISIWNCTEKDSIWKMAAADWVWLHLSDFVCDVSLTEVRDTESDISTKHMFLVMCLLGVDPAFRNDCSNWMFSLLYYIWMFHPEDKVRVANFVADFFFNHMLYDDTPMDHINIEHYLLNLCLRLFPIDFYEAILESPACKSKWGDQYEMVQVEVDKAQYRHRPSQIEDNPTEYDPECNLVDELHSKPNDWMHIVREAHNRSDDDGMKTLIQFFNDYIDMYGAGSINSRCKKTLAFWVISAPIEHRVSMRELTRRL